MSLAHPRSKEPDYPPAPSDMDSDEDEHVPVTNYKANVTYVSSNTPPNGLVSHDMDADLLTVPGPATPERRSSKRHRAPPNRFVGGGDRMDVDPITEPAPTRRSSRRSPPRKHDYAPQYTSIPPTEVVTRHGRLSRRPVSYMEAQRIADHREENYSYALRGNINGRRRASILPISPAAPSPSYGHSVHRRSTRNSMSTEFASAEAEQVSLTLEREPTYGADGDDENDEEGEDVVEDQPIHRRRLKRKKRMEEEDRLADDLEETPQSRYSMRTRNKSLSHHDPTLLDQPRQMRNRPQVDYNEGRAWRQLYESTNTDRSGPDGRGGWGSPPSIQPRRVPMANTVGGGVIGHDSDDDDAAKPLLQYARCATLVQSLPKEMQGQMQERLQMHLDNNDFPSHSSTEAKVTFDMIGGHEDHVKTIQEMIKIALLYPELTQGAEAIKGVIFYGPPGNGKTLMARAIASSCSTGSLPVSFFECNAADVHSKWFGDSEKHLRKLFEDAKANEPSIIFFDEIDGVVPARSSGENATPHNSVVTALLTLMDGLENRGRVIVIGATNRLDTLDPALLRPGRFDRRLQFKRPDMEARRKIIGIKTRSKKFNLNVDEALQSQLAVATEGYSGADLKALCSDAYFKALRRTYPQIYDSEHKLQIDPDAITVTERDFAEALRAVKPSTTADSANQQPPSLHLQNLISQSWTQVSAKLNLIWKALSHRSAGATASTLQPRLLVSGPSHMGQAQILSAASSQMTEWGFRIEVVRRSTDIADHISALRMEQLPALVVPSMETWSEEDIQLLDNELETAGHPIMVLATCSGDAQTAVRRFIKGSKTDINRLMGYRSITKVSQPTEAKRKEFFAPLLASIGRSPDPAATAIPPTALETLPVAPAAPMPVLTSVQRKALDTKCWTIMQDLKQRLRSFFKEIGKTKYRVFCHPVDVDKYQDYLEIITTPMDLGEMMSKVDDADGGYDTPEQWLADVELIVKNAKEYNEPRSDIVFKACELRDDAHAFVSAIPSKYRLNYLQVSLWRRANKADKATVPEATTEESEVQIVSELPPTKRRKVSIDGSASVPVPSSVETIPVPVDAPALAPDAMLVDKLRGLEDRMLVVTRDMDVRNLEVLYQVLEAEVEAAESETNRLVVYQSVDAKLDMVESSSLHQGDSDSDEEDL
ncbi:ATPase AAA domain-containing protein 2B [Thoreauomyces humboldtii]|nr:ATPase AAA domain-containing protein 2B [Thoreauomyces humboldtii]